MSKPISQPPSALEALAYMLRLNSAVTMVSSIIRLTPTGGSSKKPSMMDLPDGCPHLGTRCFPSCLSLPPLALICHRCRSVIAVKSIASCLLCRNARRTHTVLLYASATFDCAWLALSSLVASPNFRAHCRVRWGNTYCQLLRKSTSSSLTS